MIKAIKVQFLLLVLVVQSGLAFGSQQPGSLNIKNEGGVSGGGTVFDFGTQSLASELPFDINSVCFYKPADVTPC